MASRDSLTTQASSFSASERPKMTGVGKSGRSSNHFTKRVCFFVRKRVNQCTKECRESLELTEQSQGVIDTGTGLD